MYSFPNLETVCCSMLGSNCCFLTCAQVYQESGKMVWFSHLFKNFPQFIVIHTVKGFGVVNKAEVDVFLKFSCIFNDSSGVGNLISGSSALSKSSLNILKFTVYILLKPGLENFQHYFAIMRDKCNCAVVWILCHCLSLELEWKLIFSSPVAITKFSEFAGILSTALSQHHLLGFETAQWNSITFTSCVNSNAL